MSRKLLGTLFAVVGLTAVACGDKEDDDGEDTAAEESE
jgi:hypothetical protein